MSRYEIMVALPEADEGPAQGGEDVLAPRTESIALSVKLPGPGGRHARLAEDFELGEMRWPRGARLVPETLLRAASGPAEHLILGRIAAEEGAEGGAPGKAQGPALIFSAVPLARGAEIVIEAAEKVDLQQGMPNGLLRGTLIETPHGPLEIESLEAGDEVLARDGSTQIVSWAGRRRFSALELALGPALRPVRIRAGALPGGLPGQDLLASHAHRLVVADWRAGYLFGEEEILLPAGALLNGRTVHLEDPRAGADYHLLLVSGDGLICANGLWAETLGNDERNILAIPEEERLMAQHPFSAPIPAMPHGISPAMLGQAV